MYSPDWLDVEMKTHHEKARGALEGFCVKGVQFLLRFPERYIEPSGGGTATIKVNPLEGLGKGCCAVFGKTSRTCQDTATVKSHAELPISISLAADSADLEQKSEVPT